MAARGAAAPCTIVRHTVPDGAPTRPSTFFRARIGPTIDDTTALLWRAVDGDREALAELVARTQADVWRFCAHLVDVTSADDLAQETYLRAMGSMHRFRGDATARTWLLAVARHTCVDEIRRRTRRRDRERVVDPDTVEDVAPSHEDPAVDVGLPRELRTAIDGLDHDRRTAFVLTQVLGLSYREAAIAADVPIGTIRSRVARARADLVDALGLNHTDRDTRTA